MPEIVSGGLIKGQDESAAVIPPASSVTIEISPVRNVKVTRRKTDQSQDILLTVNKAAKVAINGVEVA